jgi:hypothetical protein
LLYVTPLLAAAADENAGHIAAFSEFESNSECHSRFAAVWRQGVTVIAGLAKREELFLTFFLKPHTSMNFTTSEPAVV